MRSIKFISAILLLGIYSGVVFHNILPHIHSETTATNEFHVVAEDSHNHGHNHHHSHDQFETNSSWIDDLLGLFEGAEHPDLGDDHFESFIAQSNHFEFILVDFSGFDFKSEFHYSFKVIEQQSASNFIGHPKILYEQHRVCSSPLRGPPSLS